MQRLSSERGLTLVELLIALTIIAITLGAALPGFSRAAERHRLEGAAAQLETELQFARSLAVSSRQNVRFTFLPGATGNCYVIHTGPAVTDCGASANEVRTTVLDAARLQITSSAGSFGFDPDKGTVTPTSTIELRNARGDALRVIVNLMGRVRTCSPNGVRGYKAC